MPTESQRAGSQVAASALTTVTGRLGYFATAAFFLYAAGLQLNDPDPLYWIVVYTAIAVISLAGAFRPFSQFWVAVAIGGVMAGLLIAAPGFFEYLRIGDFGVLFADMGAAAFIEPAREFVGLALAFMALLFFSRQQ